MIPGLHPCVSEMTHKMHIVSGKVKPQQPSLKTKKTKTYIQKDMSEFNTAPLHPLFWKIIPTLCIYR